MHQSKKELHSKRWNQRVSMDFNDNIEMDETLLNDFLQLNVEQLDINVRRGKKDL